MSEQITAQAHLTITDITDGVNANIWTTSTAPTTPNYTFTISNLTGPTGEPRVGDIILQGVYRYTITSISSTTVLAGSRQSLQGASGAAGGKWYTGTGITGTSTTATIFSGSGVSSAVVGDMYLNTSTDNVYRCTVAGAASAAKWVYTGNIKGSVGAQGKSVTKVETEYYRKLSGGSAPTASTTGSTTIPDYVDGCTYYTRTITYFNTGDPDKSSWTENTGLTNENKNAYDAWIAAGNAELKVAKVVTDSNGVTVAAGINGAAITEGTTSTYGYNTIMAPNYLGLRYNAINLAKLTTTGTTPALEFYIPTVSSGTPTQGAKGLSISSTALTFYNPSTNNAQLIIGANGTLQSGNYTRGSDSKFSSNGTKIDLINGDIITKYFRVSQGLESGLNAGVYVHGTIEALDGTIGTDSTNYWEIGNGTDYNLNSTAKMIGHGSSYVQLGDSSTWRLATNRIHTGWYTSNDSLLHFPTINSKYWDFGIHVPVSGTDKFLYIRSSKANTSASNALQNLLYDIDDTYATAQWDYPFYIDGAGNVHAPAYYVGSEPLTGGVGSIAEKIINSDSTYGKGSTTQPIFIDSNGRPATTTYALNAAGAKGVDTSITAASSSTNLPTSQAVAAFVEGKGYKTTDQNVKTEQANTTKIYLVGTSTSGTNTGTLKYDSNVYVDTTAGALKATTFNGYTLAAASAKGVDTSITTSTTSTNLPTSAAVVNLIKQYLPLSGGQVTGAVTFGSSITADELTIGDLVVNGGASFTNNLQVNTINGVTVGSSPKFTDTVTTVTVTGSGNAVTTASASNGVITLTKGTTFPTGSGTNGYLTKWTGTNTIGNGPALGSGTTKFLREDGTWVVPAGTGVTSVAASGSGGISISGSPITTSGTITIGLNLSTAINGLGEGTSPATRDDYAVVQYAGGGTTTTSYHRRKLSNVFAALNSSDITTALGYTPYNSTNPNGYITANHTSTYSLPTAKYNTLGGVKPAYSSTGAATLTTAAATNTTTPTIAAKTTTSGRYYAIEIDKNGILFVNVPWTNVNSSYLTSSSTLNWNNITQNKPTTASGYGITDAITNITATSASGGSTTFTLTKSNSTTSTFDVVVYASAATQATDANYLTDGTSRYTVGNAKKPIYFDAGIPKASDGTEGTATKPVYLSSGTLTAGSTYAGGTAVTLNGTSKGASTASFYAPTSYGTSTQVLIGGGQNATPTWTNISSLVPSTATSATNDSDGNPINTTYLKVDGSNKMTGILTLYREGTTANNYPAGIKFSVKDTTTGQTYSDAYIYAFQDHASTTYGTNMVIRSGGGMFLGSGEAPYSHYNAKGSSYGGEETFITSDGGVYIQSSDNTIANRVGMYVNSSHQVVPVKADVVTNNVGSIGTSSYKWNAMYATTFYGALSGNATSATTATTATTASTVSRDGISSNWNKGRDNALLKMTALNGYSAAISIKTNNGSWDIGAYNNASFTDDLVFTYISDTHYNGDNATDAQIKFLENGHIVAALDGNATTATRANITTTTNAVAYYTNTTGTFGSKASANGALYATSANGTLNWGTLPIAQGGTGKTTTLAAITNLGGPYILAAGTEITDSSNLDTDYTAAGTYYSPNSTRSASLSGTVVSTGSGFKMITMKGYREQNILQFVNWNDDRLIYRYSYDTTVNFGKWYQFVRLPSGSDNKTFSAVGDSTTPVYVNSSGIVTACTSYANATVGKASAANLTTTANAVAYYTNTTGTFGSKASANGALYATSANGALNWGTLPVAQGGTGATAARTAFHNLSAGLTEGTADPTDNTVFMCGNTNEATNDWYYRKAIHMWNYISGKINSSGKYVTTDTAQTLAAAATKTFLGLQTFGTNGIAFGTTSGTSVTQKVVTRYDSTLEAIVFSFA